MQTYRRRLLTGLRRIEAAPSAFELGSGLRVTRRLSPLTHGKEMGSPVK